MQPYDDIITKIDYNNILNTFSTYSLISEDAKSGTTNPYSSDNLWYTEEDIYKLGFLEYGTYWYFWEPYYWTAPDLNNDFYSFIWSANSCEEHLIVFPVIITPIP